MAESSGHDSVTCATGHNFQIRTGVFRGEARLDWVLRSFVHNGGVLVSLMVNKDLTPSGSASAHNTGIQSGAFRGEARPDRFLDYFIMVLTQHPQWMMQV